jgi:hypothetical protein
VTTAQSKSSSTLKTDSHTGQSTKQASDNQSLAFPKTNSFTTALSTFEVAANPATGQQSPPEKNVCNIL